MLTPSTQKDRGQPYLDVLASLLNPPLASDDLITFGAHFISSSSMTMVIGRRVLNLFVAALCAGSGFDKRSIPGQSEKEDDEAEWDERGSKAFKGDEGESVRQTVVEGLLARGGGSGWCDEQVSWTDG